MRCLPVWLTILASLLAAEPCEARRNCPAGSTEMRRRRRIGICKRCPPGTANAQPNHACLACPGGTYARLSGMTHCEGEICTPGSAGPIQKAAPSLCAACEPGQYQPGYGAHECRLCGSGQHQVQKGQARCEGVACPVGAVAPPGAVAN